MKITPRQLRRIIREEAHRISEDTVDRELEHLRKNIEDDKGHIDALEKDIEDDREEEEHAHDVAYHHHESRRRSGRRLTYKQLRRMIREVKRNTRRG